MNKTFAIDYEIHDHNNDRVIRDIRTSIEAETYGAAIDRFLETKHIIIHNYMKDNDFAYDFEPDEGWDEEDEDEQLKLLAMSGTLEPINILVIL